MIGSALAVITIIVALVRMKKDQAAGQIIATIAVAFAVLAVRDELHEIFTELLRIANILGSR